MQRSDSFSLVPEVDDNRYDINDWLFSIQKHGYVTNITYFHYQNQSTPFWRLYWNTIPGGILHCPHGTDIVMETGCFYLIPAYFNFDTDLTQPFEHVSVHFNFSDIVKTKCDHVIRIKGDNFSHMLINDYMNSWRIDDNKLRCDLLAHTLTGYAIQLAQNGICLQKRPKNIHIFKCINYICNHLESNIDNNRLAMISGQTRSAFIRLFTETMGEPPQTFVRRKRVERACLMLNSTTLTIKEIALRLGFSNQYHFSKVFSKIQNQNPSAFRYGHQSYQDTFKTEP